MIVVDSNVLAARNLTSERSRLASQVELRDRHWLVPPLWRYEFQNILTKAIWAGQLTSMDALRTWEVVASRMSENEQEPAPERIISLATRHRITAYDANFMALAMEMGVVCVTEDRELRDKFPGIAVSMEEFVGRGESDWTAREPQAPYGGSKRTKPARKAGRG